MDTLLYIVIAGLGLATLYLYDTLKKEREKSKRYVQTVALMLLDERHIDHVRNHFAAEFDPLITELNVPKRGEKPADASFWLMHARHWLPAAEKAARNVGSSSEDSFAYALEAHYSNHLDETKSAPLRGAS